MPTITVDGRERSYRLDAPQRPRSLVLVFHGFGGGGEEMRRGAGFSRLLDTHRAAFVYPDGLPDAKGKRNFQVGYHFQDPKIDDVAFARALVARLTAQLKISPRRVFATGMSNGGDMSFFPARQKRPFVRAVAPVCGCMMVGWDRTLTAKNRIPVLAVNGTADTTTLWAGDLANRDSWGPYYGAEAVAQRRATDLALEKRESEAGEAITRTRWWTRRDAVEYVLHTRHGGGHDWPAHLGDPKRSLAEEILDFFENHPQDQ